MVNRSGWMVLEDKMETFVSGLGSGDGVEGKTSWRWSHPEIGAPADWVCEGIVEKVSFELLVYV